MNIKEAVESFINFRRSIGRKDESKTYTLRLFANFRLTRQTLCLPKDH